MTALESQRALYRRPITPRDARSSILSDPVAAILASRAKNRPFGGRIHSPRLETPVKRPQSKQPLFLPITPRPAPAAAIDHAREQALADERDTLAINRLFAVVLNDALPSNCSRCGSSQHANRKGKRNGGTKAR